MRVWNPDKRGETLIVWRPWYRSKLKSYATSTEITMRYRWGQDQEADYSALGLRPAEKGD